jgi:hypothetical protein
LCAGSKPPAALSAYPAPRARLYAESAGRTSSEEDGQLPLATECFGVEIMIYSFQSWNIVEEIETRV